MECGYRNLHILNRAGFSLIELMVSAAVLSVVMLGLSVALRTSLKSGTTADWMVEQAALLKDAQGILSNPTLCTKALISTSAQIGAAPKEVSLTPSTCTYPPNPAAVPTNCAANGAGIYAGANYDGRTQIQHVYFKNVNPVDPTKNSYSAEVEIIGQSLGTSTSGENQNISGNAVFDRTMQVYFTTVGALSPSSPLSTCLGAWSNDAQTNCLIVGGYWTGTSCNMCQAIGCIPNASWTTCTCAPGSCTVPAGMAWTVGSDTCNADSTTIIPNGSSGTVIDTTGPTTGAGKFSCSSGSLTYNPSTSTCSSVQCNSATLTWGSSPSCTAVAPPTDAGTNSPLLVSGSPTGAATFLCQSTGSWAPSPNAGATCSSTVNCPANASWAWGGGCTGSTAVGVSTNGTSTPNIANTNANFSGGAKFLCTGGSWNYSSGSCTCTGTWGFEGRIPCPNPHHYPIDTTYYGPYATLAACNASRGGLCPLTRCTCGYP